MFAKAISKLDIDEQNKYSSQFQWFSKKVAKALDDAGIRVVTLDGQLYDPGMAVTPLNIEDFEADDILYVAQTMEPIIMQDAPNYGAYRNSCDRTTMDIDRSVDHKRSLVAVRYLGVCGNTVGNRCFNQLFQACCIYLSRMSWGIQAPFQGSILGVPHTQNAPSDLSEVRT